MGQLFAMSLSLRLTSSDDWQRLSPSKETVAVLRPETRREPGLVSRRKAWIGLASCRESVAREFQTNSIGILCKLIIQLELVPGKYHCSAGES